MKHKWLWVLGLILLGLWLGAAGGVILDRLVLVRVTPPAASQAAAPNFRLLDQAWNTIQQDYVDRAALQPEQLTYGAISGMVDALGDTGHSRFMTPEMVNQERDFTQGQFEGIGAEVQIKDRHLTIVAPMDGSPAQQAGLKPGDVILKVDGQDITALPLDQIMGRILGPAGSKVTLTVLDPISGNQRDVTIVRARIVLHPVTWQQLPGAKIAHIRIASFSQGVTDTLQKALKEIQAAGLTGVILDLRNDPGGLLDEAVGVASQFLKDGNVLQEKNAQGEVKPVPVKEGGAALDVPLAVLINAGTASAAEIVAAALQDAGRAKLIGETTFGTGTVLNRFNLDDGSALLLATEEWLTPAGRVIWHRGVAADIAVSLPSNAGTLTPEAERDLTAAQLRASGDAQLLKGLESLGRQE